MTVTGRSPVSVGNRGGPNYVEDEGWQKWGVDQYAKRPTRVI
jgi:hypothetical protein